MTNNIGTGFVTQQWIEERSRNTFYAKHLLRHFDGVDCEIGCFFFEKSAKNTITCLPF